MKLIDVIKLALQNLKRTKFRSFLTILGVTIGISAIVLFVSLGVGLQQITSNQIASLSALTTISVSQTQATASMEEGSPLTLKTVEQIRRIDGVESISPSVSLPTNISFADSSTGGIVYGIKAENQNIEASNLMSGVQFKDQNEAIISTALANALSGDPQSIVGKKIAIKIIKTDITEQTEILELTVIGIDNNDTTNIVYASLDKIYKLGNFEKYSTIKVKVKSRNDVDPVKDEIKSWGYQVATIKDLIDQIDKFFLLVQIILGVVSGIGLLVSSLGIINTMTISLLERTREIGIMKAIGAANRDIKRLFYMESALIGLLGGLIGIGIAVGLSQLTNYVINSFIQSSGQHLNLFVTPINFSLAMVLFAVVISVLAGVYPAYRAQRLPLIVALYQ